MLLRNPLPGSPTDPFPDRAGGHTKTYLAGTFLSVVWAFLTFPFLPQATGGCHRVGSVTDQRFERKEAGRPRPRNRPSTVGRGASGQVLVPSTAWYRRSLRARKTTPRPLRGNFRAVNVKSKCGTPLHTCQTRFLSSFVDISPSQTTWAWSATDRNERGSRKLCPSGSNRADSPGTALAPVKCFV